MSNAVRTLTIDEERKLLKVSLDHVRGLRDHVAIMVALKTGLREHEILALNVGDIFDADGNVRQAVQLTTFKRCNMDATSQCVFLTHPVLRDRLSKLYSFKRREGQSLDPAAPLLVSREKNRLSARQLRHAFGQWQRLAGFDRPVRFHDLRHTACTAYMRAAAGNMRAVQKFARHKSITSTQIYTHVTDEYQAATVRRM